MFNHNYLHTTYADDTAFFLNNQKLISELMKTFFWLKTLYIKI